jgi:hypothetical protein
MLTDLLNRPITIVSRTDGDATDEYGNEIPDEAMTSTVGELQQERRDEPGASGETSDTRWLLVVPAGTVINTGDAVIVDNEVYEVVGAPWPARNPRTGTTSHVEASLRRTAGDEGGS